jgi:uncharacterized protein
LKILLFLLTVLFAVWLWRRNRLNALNERQSKSSETAKPNNASPLEPSPMQACLHCGVHMPATDMVQGKRGLYCSQAHRQAAADTAL